MTAIASELWSLIPGGRQVDPARLAAAIIKQIESRDLDFRTRELKPTDHESFRWRGGFSIPNPFRKSPR